MLVKTNDLVANMFTTWFEGSADIEFTRPSQLGIVGVRNELPRRVQQIPKKFQNRDTTGLYRTSHARYHRIGREIDLQ